MNSLSIRPFACAQLLCYFVVVLSLLGCGGQSGAASTGFSSTSPAATGAISHKEDNQANLSSSLAATSSSAESVVSSSEDSSPSSSSISSSSAVMALSSDASTSSSSSSSATETYFSSSLTSSSLASANKSSSSKSAPFVDKTAPIAPAKLMVTSVGVDFVHLSWTLTTDNVGVASYRIFRDSVQIDKVDAFTYDYIDYGAAPGKSYTYGVSAGDDADNWSAITSVQAQTNTPSSASKASSVSSSSATSSAQSSAQSSASKQSSSAQNSTSQASSASQTSSASQASTTTTSSSKSSASAADTTSPSSPPVVNKDLALSYRVDLSWQAASDNVAVTQYRVYRDATLLQTLDATTLSYSDTTVTANNYYSFSVSAGDAAGNWSAQKTIFVTTPPNSSNTDAQLIWNHPSIRENLSFLAQKDISGYHIRYHSSGSLDYTDIMVNGNLTTAYTVANISSDSLFEIACIDSNGRHGEFAAITPH